MRLLILGGPVVGKVSVDVTADKPFGDLFALIQAAVDKGALWDKFQLNVAEVHDRKVKPTARVVQSTDTAESLGLPSDGAVLLLRPLDRTTPVKPAAADKITDANSTPPTSTRGNYRSRMIAMYQRYEPSKVGTVDASLQRFKGKEEAVIRQLVKKYGPEPDAVASGEEAPLSPVVEVIPESNDLSHGGNDAASYHDRLFSIYRKYDPSKVGTVRATLEKFKGKEEAVIRQLVKKYGPEPAVTTQTPSGSTPGPQQTVIPPVSSSPPPPPAAAAAASPAVDSTPPTSTRGNYRSRMIAMYQKYEPSKVGTVDASLQRFKGKEEAVIRQLVKKYGPEPDAVASGNPPQSPPKNGDVSPAGSVTPQKLQDAETHAETPVSPPKDPQSAVGILNGAPPPAPTAPSNTNKDVLLEPPRETPNSMPSTALKGNNILHVESYGLQSFISPPDHEPLVEPLSEADGNSTVTEEEEEEEGEEEGTTRVKDSKDSRLPRNLSFRTAATIMRQETFDTTRPMLRDLELSSSVKRWGQKNVLEGRHASIITNNRLQGVVKCAVERLSKSAANVVRQVYWRRWQYKVARRRANELVQEKVWVRTRGGARLVDSVPHTFDVSNLEDYVYERHIFAGERSVGFSDTLQKALRELLYTAKHHLMEANDTEDTSFFCDKDLCPVRDTKELASALCMLKNMLIDFAETKSIVNLRERELWKLRDTNDVLRAKLEEAKTSLSHLTQAREEITVLKAQCDELKEELGQAQEGWKAAKYQVQFLQRELKTERNQAPSNAEQLLQQKDHEVASLQRELSKLRTKLHRETREKESLESQLKEAKAEAAHTAQKLEKWLSSAASVGRGRSVGAVAPQLNLPREAFSGFLRVTKNIREKEFLPMGVAEGVGEGASLVEKTNEDLARENLQLEVDLRQQAVVSEIEFGNCPHCRRRLTSCSATPTGSPGSKAAFCFSCRRSYTFGDLMAREKSSAAPLVKRGRDSSLRGFAEVNH